ncbi:hypothetical protein ACVIIV_003192 [Bradyrhizobium sp. USDA 4354]
MKVTMSNTSVFDDLIRGRTSSSTGSGLVPRSETSGYRAICLTRSSAPFNRLLIENKAIFFRDQRHDDAEHERFAI